MKSDKNNIILIILCFLIPLIKPAEDALAMLIGESLSHVCIRILSIWDYLSIAICVVLFIFSVYKKNIKIRPYTYVIIGFCVVFLIATFREYAFDLFYTARTLGNWILLILLANLFSDDRFDYFLKALYWYLTVLSVINSISIYVYYPEGMNAPNYYLYALDNVGFITALHAFFVGIICQLVDYGKIKKKFIALFMFIFGAYVYAGAGTAIIIIILSGILLLTYDSSLGKFFKYNVVMICGWLSFFFIAVSRTTGIFTMVSELLGKGITFNGRTVIWDAMFNVLPHHMILGFGITPEVTQHYLGLYPSGGWLEGIGHMHNIVYEFLFRGGIVGLILFIVFWIMCAYSLKGKENGKIYGMLCGQLLLSWMTCMFEFRLDTYTFWIVPICLFEIKSIGQSVITKKILEKQK